MSIGVPIKLLQEAMGHTVTVELKTGDVYRGKLLEAEDNMNVQMTGVTVTRRDGRVTQVERVFMRGSQCRWFIVPDILSQAPMFKKIGVTVPRSGVAAQPKRGRPARGGGIARGRGMATR